MLLSPPGAASTTAFLEATVGRLSAHLFRIAPDRGFLEPLARRFAGAVLDEPAALRERLRAAQGESDELLRGLGPSSPLARLIAAHRLSRLESDILSLALLPDLDDRFGDIFFALRAGVPPRRPTLGIALRALFDEYGARWQARSYLDRSPLWDGGLLRLEAGRGASDPAGMDRILCPSAPVVAAAFGHLPARLETGAEVLVVPPLDTGDAPLREGLAALLAELCAWVESVQAGVLHLVCESPGDAPALAARVARAFGRPLVHVPDASRELEVLLQQAASCATMASGLLLVEASPGEPLRLSPSFCPTGPVFLATPPGCEVAIPARLAGRRVELPRPRPLEQLALWRAAVGGRAADVRLHVLANRTHLSGAQIDRAAARAVERAARAGKPAVGDDDVVEALRETIPDPSSSLARWSRPRVPWSSLVADRETRAQLEDLVHRIEHRVTVQDEWSMSGPSGRGEGLVALFHGEPGTGKTLAVEAIASRLGLSLLRVDLSRVVSKYIGETEKHLASLFDQAEGFRAVLFFDEADTLFAKRTGVKDAHDRYANLETNYMLGRLEGFEGIALLATNLLQNVDTAFLRRLQLIVPFPRPTPALRRRLWVAHLPEGRLAEDVDVDLLATRHDLVGGEIRNAALSAAFAAAASSCRITAAMLDQAIVAERLKAGKSIR
ncbi:ATP-binding protein [Sorangium sp. So ce269]